MTITEKMCAEDMAEVVQVLDKIGDDWDGEKLEQFLVEWAELELDGAMLVDFQIIGGKLVTVIADDFKQHLRKWGAIE